MFAGMLHGFVDERAMIATALKSSCHWKTLGPFYLRKKKPKNICNTNSELLQNLTENQIMPSKTTVN